MVRIVLGIVLAAMLPSAVSAQSDWRSQLGQELVSVEGDLMVIDRVAMERVAFPGTEPLQMQVRYRSTAPVDGVVSRDQFVAQTSALSQTTILAVFSGYYQVGLADFLEAYSSAELYEGIGVPDIEITLTMTNAGIQFEIVYTASGQTNRVTQTWDEVFATQR